MQEHCRSVVVLIILQLAVMSASAQVSRIDSEYEFDSDSVILSFDHLAQGAAVGDIFSSWGVTFLTSDLTEPRVTVASGPAPPILSPPPGSAIRNFVDSPPSADTAIILNFQFPVQAVGLRLGNGRLNAGATLRAFDHLGNQLGEVGHLQGDHQLQR